MCERERERVGRGRAHINSFILLDKLVTMQPIRANTRGRSQELWAYMQALGLAPVMPVFAVVTRWGSWIEAVQYLAENLYILCDFIPSLPLSSKAVWDLRVLLEEKEAILKAHAIFIVEHSTEIKTTITKLQETSNPSAATIHGQLERG